MFAALVEGPVMVRGRRVARSLLGASLAALAAVAAPAEAQRVNNIVAFGDSYADDGNLFEIIGFNPQPLVYPTGRFSGGTIMSTRCRNC